MLDRPLPDPPLPDPKPRRRRAITRSLLETLRRRRQHSLPVGTLLSDLGERSFGWAILSFALVNMLPLPFGSNVVTAIPLLILTAQLALGYRHVALPDFINRQSVPRDSFSRLLLRVKPLARPIERIIRPRRSWLFEPRAECLVGGVLFAVSCALFLPIPFSGLLSAAALAVAGLGLIERDGTVTLLGLALGAFAILITAGVLIMILIGFTVLGLPFGGGN